MTKSNQNKFSNSKARWDSIALSDKIDSYIQKGYNITYDIVNQIENGSEESVKNGTIKLYTYTFYIYRPKSVDFCECLSVDNLYTGFVESIKYLESLEELTNDI